MDGLICVICGNKYGRPRGTYATWYPGTCDWCGEETSVTEARDFGYPPPPPEKKGESDAVSESRNKR